MILDLIADPDTRSRPPLEPKVDLQGITTSTNWSGAIIKSILVPGTYSGWYSISGEWTVPAVTGDVGIVSKAWAWVGIDGWPSLGGGNYVVQGGTQSNYLGGNTQPLSAYYAWHEYWNGPDPNEQWAQTWSSIVKNLYV